MYKPGIVCLIFLLLTNVTKGQIALSLDFGVNQNLLKTNLSNLDAINSVYTTGFQIGAGFSKKITAWLGYEGQLLYINKNNKIARHGFFSEIHREVKTDYLQLPLLLQFKINVSEKTVGHFGVGGFVGYWLGGRTNASFPNVLAPKDYNEETVYENIYQIISRHNISEKYPFSDLDNRFEYGTALGVGFTHRLNDRYGFVCRLRNYMSLSDVQREYQMSKKNLTTSISVGVLVNIK